MSLSNKGLDTELSDLKGLYEAIRLLKETKHGGVVMMDVPVNKASALVGYSDSSWANAEGSRSQFGVLTLLCAPDVAQRASSPADRS